RHRVRLHHHHRDSPEERRHNRRSRHVSAHAEHTARGQPKAPERRERQPRQRLHLLPDTHLIQSAHFDLLQLEPFRRNQPPLPPPPRAAAPKRRARPRRRSSRATASKGMTCPPVPPPAIK